MAQTPSTEYAGLDEDPHKEPRFVVAIGGWPTLYAVGSETLTIPATGDLSTATGHTAIRNWASLPDSAGQKTKTNRPESGGTSLGQVDVDILDRYDDDVGRAISDLISRQAYLEGTSSGTITQLNASADLSISSGTVTVDDTTGFASSGNIWISQECIHYTGTTGTTFTGCTRGYLLTAASPHLDNVKVYSFKPALFMSQFYVYKGYAGLALDKWLEDFGGTIVGEGKSPGSVNFSARSTAWETYLDKRKLVANVKFPEDGSLTSYYNAGTFTIAGRPWLQGDYKIDVDVTVPTSVDLGDGHYLIKFGGYWMGIREILSSQQIHNGTRMLCRCVRISTRGLQHNSGSITSTGNVFPVAWSNCDFRTLPVVGTDPITLMLQFLISKKGAGTNYSGSGTNYDVLKRGGLGIPESRIDIAAFEAIQDEYDYDTNCRVFFVFTGPVPAKKFFDDELCKPFGWYLATKNDGRITLIRPKHPQKFHVSRANGTLAFNSPTASTAFAATMTAGIYTGQEMATEVARAMNDAIKGRGLGTFTCTYNTSTHVFTVAISAGTFDITGTSGVAWTALGFTSDRTNATSEVGDAARGAFTEDTVGQTTYNVIDENDLWDVEIVDNRGDQITDTSFRCSWSWDEEKFLMTHWRKLAEQADLIGSDNAFHYAVESKGLLANNWAGVATPFTGATEADAGTCEPNIDHVSTDFGIDAPNSWAHLFSEMLFDRYGVPPILFKCKMKWKYNTREIGDDFKLSYAVDGVFADRERNATTLTSRLFEFLAVKPNRKGGYIEATCLGWPYVSY